jgi:hypothetical protein
LWVIGAAAWVLFLLGRWESTSTLAILESPAVVLAGLFFPVAGAIEWGMALRIGKTMRFYLGPDGIADERRQAPEPWSRVQEIEVGADRLKFDLSTRPEGPRESLVFFPRAFVRGEEAVRAVEWYGRELGIPRKTG